MLAHGNDRFGSKGDINIALSHLFGRLA